MKSDLVHALLQIESKKDMEDFLLGILTPGEYSDISQRLEILRLLRHGYPHREIAKTLGVGISTVTRGSREIKSGRFKYLKQEE
ncbi:MAG: Trp family transcriptional regulator [Patescibacteria group bacterium]